MDAEAIVLYERLLAFTVIILIPSIVALIGVGYLILVTLGKTKYQKGRKQ